MLFELNDFTDDELLKMREQVDKEIQKRFNEEKRKAIDEACASIKKLDSVLQHTIIVEVSDPFSDYTEKIDVDLDLLELCNALREYRP